MTDVLVAASLPWSFTQTEPLTTSDFCVEAAKRGVRVSVDQLRELWRVGALAPLVEIRTRPAHEPPPSVVDEPISRGTCLTELRRARDSGRLVDPAELGFRPQLLFSRAPDQRVAPRRWWNGLLYSRWQLLELHDVRKVLDQGSWRGHGEARRWRSRPLHDWELDGVARSRHLIAVLVALEARYLPRLEHPWVHLTNATVEEWDRFVETFDADAVLRKLGWSADQLLGAADRLLLGLRELDPLSRDWSELLRRAPHRTWSKVSGNLLAALHRRIAAEVLLLCYEELAGKGDTPLLTERTDSFHSATERLSYRSQSLDATLSTLGISPHPGVVLVVEGETEELLVPRVREHIRVPRQAEVIRSVVLRGVRGDLTKLAAFANAPLIEGKEGEHWLLVKPPTYLLVVVDPDPPFDTSDHVEAERTKIVDEMIEVVRAQGVEPDRDDIDSLIEVSTWTERCFEFAHFTDGELSEALHALHSDCGGLDRVGLEDALRAQRSHHQDIKKVWRNWRRPPSKRALAEALWPVLRTKLDAAADDPSAEPPPIAQKLIHAFHQAMQRPRGRFVIRGAPISK